MQNSHVSSAPLPLPCVPAYDCAMRNADMGNNEILRNIQALGSAASERMDRIASVSDQTGKAFEERNAATQWMSRPN